jgi:alpha-tubulin suppressor-like RCC1 family protein
MHRHSWLVLLGVAVLGFFIANLADHEPSSLIFADNTSTLLSWGWNGYGQLGDGTTTKRHTPTQESTGATNWSAIAAGSTHTVARRSDGTLWAWGLNEYGRLGDGSNVDKTTPTQESTGSTNWSAIAAGIGHTVALKSGGTQPTPTPISTTSAWGLAALVAALLVMITVLLRRTSGHRPATRP